MSRQGGVANLAFAIRVLALVFAVTAAGVEASRVSSLDVQLGKPRLVAVAERDEGWGRFCFPRLSQWTDGAISVGYSVSADSIASYGSKPGMSISRDGGKTWSDFRGKPGVRGLLLPNGDRIAVATPKAYPISELQLPKPAGERLRAGSETEQTLYRLDALQPNLRTIRISRFAKGSTQAVSEQAALYDPAALRYSVGGLFPILFWGDLRLAPDGSILAGVYPGLMVRDDGSVDPKGHVFFYRSADSGHSWKIQGRVLYEPDLRSDPRGRERDGFQEPTFAVLGDGSLLCVMRTTDGIGIGPLYASSSPDLGKTWTKPRVIAPNGVMPKLLRLDNGVLVLSSGRPGVQLRFCADGKGRHWTGPYDLVPVTSKDARADTCGYTSLLPLGPDRLLVAYSSFKHGTGSGQTRKAILVREVTVRTGGR